MPSSAEWQRCASIRRQRVPIEMIRIDDRLIHGQVVVGWGQHFDLRLIILVHDDVAASEWEQELYRLGVPSDVTVIFASVADAAERLEEWRADPRHGMVLVPDVDTARRLVDAGVPVGTLNLGGIHHRPGRTRKLRYIYLTQEEESELRMLSARGIAISAQDVPTARAVPLAEVLGGAGS